MPLRRLYVPCMSSKVAIVGPKIAKYRKSALGAPLTENFEIVKNVFPSLLMVLYGSYVVGDPHMATPGSILWGSIWAGYWPPRVI